jgi:hypothetical protein
MDCPFPSYIKFGTCIQSVIKGCCLRSGCCAFRRTETSVPTSFRFWPAILDAAEDPRLATRTTRAYALSFFPISPGSSRPVPKRRLERAAIEEPTGHVPLRLCLQRVRPCRSLHRSRRYPPADFLARSKYPLKSPETETSTLRSPSIDSRPGRSGLWLY